MIVETLVIAIAPLIVINVVKANVRGIRRTGAMWVEKKIRTPTRNARREVLL
jgi:hypothetical protein